jgi:hybrid cluster-associated redox disulfide protein
MTKEAGGRMQKAEGKKREIDYCLLPCAYCILNFKEENMAKKRFNKDMVIGDILERSPDAIKVIEKYFGQGCFTCPGMKMESISFGALMHNIDPEVIIRELNNLENKQLKS